MALPNSNISFSAIASELKRPSTRTSLGDTDVRGLAGVPSGAVSVSNLKGKTFGFKFTAQLTSRPMTGTGYNTPVIRPPSVNEKPLSYNRIGVCLNPSTGVAFSISDPSPIPKAVIYNNKRYPHTGKIYSGGESKYYEYDINRELEGIFAKMPLDTNFTVYLEY